MTRSPKGRPDAAEEPGVEGCGRWILEFTLVWLSSGWLSLQAMWATVRSLCGEFPWTSEQPAPWAFCDDNMPRVSMWVAFWALLTLIGFAAVRLVTVGLRRRGGSTTRTRA